MVGFDYMLMPRDADAFALMVQVSAPWLWGKRKAEHERAAREAERAAAAARATANAAGFEDAEATARADATQAQLRVLRDQVLPVAEQALEATRSNYGTGQAELVSLLETERALLDIRLAVVRQRAALADAIADLRRARGLDLLPEVKP
jgi:outer membrane protein TolC